MNIGVLALQGAVREHVRALAAVGVHASTVRRPEELAAVDGLLLPGGESTTMVKLATAFDLLEPLRTRVRDGLPVFGSCAGMILLADRLVDGIAGQQTIGGLDVTVRRNAFGRQVDSFEGAVRVVGLDGAPMRAVFIRAPWVESVGPGAEVLGRVDDVLGPAPGGPVAPADAQAPETATGRVVVVRQGALLATSFHPELTDDVRLHALFVGMVAEARR